MLIDVGRKTPDKSDRVYPDALSSQCWLEAPRAAAPHQHLTAASSTELDQISQTSLFGVFCVCAVYIHELCNPRCDPTVEK